MGVFKTYDIRGIYGKEIDERLAYRIGRALGRHLRASSWLLGYDARQHSPGLYRAIGAALLDEGAQVTGIGLASTPQLHFTQVRRGFAAGVMITASHNPPEYHGCKVYDASGGSVSYDKGLDRVEQLVAGIPAPTRIALRAFPEIDSLDEYVEFVASAGMHKGGGDSDAQGGSRAERDGSLGSRPGAARGAKMKSRVVIDVSNGSAGRIFARLVRTLGADAVLLNERPDGTFPGHDPNPLKAESRRQVAAAVVRRKADFGVVLDGDGDRILFVDERGSGIENYFLACLIAEELLADHPGAAIVHDLISSRVLPERVAELGGRPVVSRVGYTFLYDRMVAAGAQFGAETSGHVYFKVTDTYYTESAAYALVVLARLLDRQSCPLSELVAPLAARYAQSPEVNVEVADKAAAMARIEAAFPGGTVERLDGVSIAFHDFWFNLRPSNTEPLLRLRLEARTAAIAAARVEEIRGLLSAH